MYSPEGPQNCRTDTVCRDDDPPRSASSRPFLTLPRLFLRSRGACMNGSLGGHAGLLSACPRLLGRVCLPG